MREADTGSGMSHYCVWSEDSRALFILGYGRVREYGHLALPMIYDIEHDTLYSVARGG